MISKRERKFLTSKLAAELVARYGNGKYFTWQQVKRTCQELHRSPEKLLPYAYALFCTQENFESIRDAEDIEKSYEALRTDLEVGLTNARPFSTGKTIQANSPFYESGIGKQTVI